jgi:hypothetical protein
MSPILKAKNIKAVCMFIFMSGAININTATSMKQSSINSSIEKKNVLQARVINGRDLINNGINDHGKWHSPEELFLNNLKLNNSDFKEVTTQNQFKVVYLNDNNIGDLSIIAEKFPNIEKLYICNNNSETESKITTLKNIQELANCKKLTHLFISDNKGLFDNSDNPVEFSELSGLLSLSVSGVQSSSDFISSVKTHMPKLESLTIKQTTNIISFLELYENESMKFISVSGVDKYDKLTVDASRPLQKKPTLSYAYKFPENCPECIAKLEYYLPAIKESKDIMINGNLINKTIETFVLEVFNKHLTKGKEDRKNKLLNEWEPNTTELNIINRMSVYKEYYNQPFIMAGVFHKRTVAIDMIEWIPTSLYYESKSSNKEKPLADKISNWNAKWLEYQSKKDKLIVDSFNDIRKNIQKQNESQDNNSAQNSKEDDSGVEEDSENRIEE